MAESVINSGTKGGRVMSVSEFQVVDEYTVNICGYDLGIILGNTYVIFVSRH